MTIISKVKTPMAVEFGSTLLGWSTKSNVLLSVFPASLLKPVKSPSWLKIINTANPVRKPVITELEIKRVIVPNFSNPNINWKSPTIIESVTIAGRIVSRGNSISELPTMIINALVGAICINSELVKNAPTGVATINALNA